MGLHCSAAHHTALHRMLGIGSGLEKSSSLSFIPWTYPPGLVNLWHVEAKSQQSWSSQRSQLCWLTPWKSFSSLSSLAHACTRSVFTRSEDRLLLGLYIYCQFSSSELDVLIWAMLMLHRHNSLPGVPGQSHQLQRTWLILNISSTCPQEKHQQPPAPFHHTKGIK